MKLSTMLYSALVLIPLVSSAACLEAPDDEGTDVIEFEKNGKLGERQVWLYAGKSTPLTMECDEWFSCDVQFWAKPCESWIEGTNLAIGAHLASIGKVKVCTPEGGCSQVGDSENFTYEAENDTQRVDDSGYRLVVNPSTGQPELKYVYDYDIVVLATTHPVEQYFTIGSLHKKSKVTASISLPANATAPVCMIVDGKYW